MTMNRIVVALYLRRSLLLAVSLSFAALIGCTGGTSGIYDFDGDGSADEDDCDSADPNIYPGAEDRYGDGIDQNCDGVDGIDSDGDGYASTDSGGDDCNDGDAGIHPGAEDPDDTIDQDCDGFGRQTTVDLRPDNPTTSDQLYLQVDSDSAVLGIAWFVDGVERTEYSGFEEIPGSQTSRDQAWRVEVTPYSGNGQAGAVASDSVIILNSAPSAATLIQGLDPDPKEGDVLSAIASASDDDLDTVTMLHAWFVNEVQVSPSPADQLDSTHFDKGDSIYLVLTPSDGIDEGTPVTSNTVTAVNTAPLAVSAALDPTEGTEESTFSCAVSGWQDPDPADSEAYDVQWYINEVVSVPTATLNGASFDRGDTLRCEATPNDGEATGSTLVSDAVTVGNTAPVISSVTIDPAAGNQGTTFTCLPAGWVDPDPADATPAYSFQWYVGAAGSEVASVTTETIDGSSFDRGDSIYCEATPLNVVIASMPAEAGSPVASAASVVGNALPQIDWALIETTGPTASAAWPNATTTDTLIVNPWGWSDADGDTEGYQYQWSIQDPAGNVLSSSTTQTLAPTETLRGDTITVVVTPNDGIDSGSPVIAGIDVDSEGTPDVFELVIANTPPDAPMVSASPASPQSSDDLVCSIATESTDPDVTDGVDSLSYDFQWLNDSGPSSFVLLAGTASSTLSVPNAETSQGDTWTCEVTPYDSEGAGTPDSSLLVINTPPTTPTISVSIGTAPADADLLCAIATAATDPDGDPLSYDFEWLDPNGNVAYSLAGGAESATLSVPAAATSEDDTWTCSVSASDGLAAGPAAQETIVVPTVQACSGLSFDGVDDYVEVADAAGLDLRTQMTVSAWTRVTTKPMGNFIVAKGRDSSSTYAWALNVTAEAYPLMVLYEPGDNPHALGESTVADERWYHIAGTYDGAELKVYLDGVLDSSTQTTLDPGDQSLPVLIGRWPNQSYFLDGEISEIVLYDTALAASDIEQLRDAGPSAVTSASPVAWWDFEDATGSTLSDISGNNHHGTIHGGATWTSSCPSEDLDGDGVPTWQDCDDDDEDSTVHAEDSNCDGVEDLATSGGIEFIGLAGGTFEMGCTAAQVATGECHANESPVHTVTLTNNFWLGETEVTQDQWEDLMGNNPSTHSSCGGNCPVDRVSWWAAITLANAASAAEGLAECYTLTGCSGTAGSGLSCTGFSVNSPSGAPYDCEGYRLPMEAEWEYAARAGTDLVYPGSDTADDVAWWGAGHSGTGNSAATTHPVRGLMPNGWGFYDLGGNAGEWVFDGKDDTYYATSPPTNPVGGTNLSQRVKRGGNYWSDNWSLRVADRSAYPIASLSESIGVRLARTVPRGPNLSCEGVSFPGSASIQIPDHADLKFGTAFSFSAWVLPTSSTDDSVIAKPRTAGSFQSSGLWFRASTNWTQIGWCESSSCQAECGVASLGLPAGTWSHVGGTWDGSTVRLFIDGTEVSQNNCSTTPGSVDDTPLLIGLEYIAAPDSRSYHGDIFEVAAWDYAISAADMLDAADMDTVPPGTPVGYWPLDEGSGTVATDASGNGHHGTLDSALSWTTSCPNQDEDGDGYGATEDCDDNDPSVTLCLSTWNEVTSASSSGPSGLAMGSMAYDPSSQRVIHFGGEIATYSNESAETWSWDGQNWTQLFPTTSPGRRKGAGFAYDSTLGGLVLFGGKRYDGSYNGVYLNDTWLWDGSDWQALSPTTPPSPRAVDLSANPGGGLFLHGGEACKDQNCIQSDTFVFANGQWSPQSATGGPGAIQSHQTVYDSSQQLALLYDLSATDPDIYTWDGSDWGVVTAAPPSPQLTSTMMAYYPAVQTTILFAGLDTTGTRSDQTWAWDGSDWELLTLSGTPPARNSPLLAYDELNEEMVLFGGQSGWSSGGIFLSDTWVLR